MRGLPVNEKSLLPSNTPLTEDDILKPKSGWLSPYNVSSLVVNQKDRVINWLAGAVRVPTETFDDFGKVGEDDRRDKFHKFHEYLEKSFPLVHKHLKRTPVYTHAVLFEWGGTDPSLKPLLLTGHSGKNLWKHDPFSGYYDGEYIWGRGSSDEKSGLIGALAAVELLLESGKFNPTRTVLLAFGNEEEIAGNVGSLALSHLIEEKYGKDSIAILIDEGNGVDEAWGQLFAAPAVGEKGSTNIQIKVETQGGHSSVPPSHTGIGYISLLIAALEAHPFKPDLQIDSPLVNYITCAADAAPGIPKDLKKNALRLANSVDSKKGKFDRKALKAIEDWWVTGSYEDGTLPQGKGRALVSTTQAVDIINGGLKVNALPESVSAVVNHRINIASSVAKLKEHIEAVLAPAATKLNLSIEAFGKKVNLLEGPKAGKVIVDTTKFGLDPAPLSPFTLDDPAWRVFTGTAKGVYATRPEAYINEDEAKKEIFTVPALSTGNTDTRQYWNLTRNIYQFAYQHGKNQHLNNAHTVNEAISADVFVEQVRWFLNFIVNVDEATDL
ncbi:Gly-Xaa carboxypeptidase [Kwoniella mangroviensis CBS 10435]|uniref:Gly-Xaa carboxypeptidase n=1 Tax=Kwoniella mangroviensis CBS 10435 TaxID=1331196 RepID=A0A1B9IQ01_9TREE|nr:Gly-Xaa carboxypeptidase [Kwoniella mangroviensis CBS 10435]